MSASDHSALVTYCTYTRSNHGFNSDNMTQGLNNKRKENRVSREDGTKR